MLSDPLHVVQKAVKAFNHLKINYLIGGSLARGGMNPASENPKPVKTGCGRCLHGSVFSSRPSALSGSVSVSILFIFLEVEISL